MAKLTKCLHQKAEGYAYDEIIDGFKGSMKKFSSDKN